MTLPVGYTMRRITDEDYPALEALFAHSFGKSDAGVLRDKFATAMFGAQNLGFVALYEHEIAAYYGVLPVRMQIAGQPILGAQSGDTMTHSDHRKKGLFLELARATYALARDEQVEVIFGFPNEFTLPGFQTHLEWSFLPNMVGLTFKGRKKWWPKSSRAVSSALGKIESAVFPMGDHDGVLVEQDYLAYKARTSNSMVIEFEALKAWVIPGKRLDVGGFAFDGDDLQATLIQLLRYCGAQSMRFTYTEGHPQLELLAPFCTQHESTPVGYLPLVADKFTDMHFSRGDFDYF